MSRFVIRTDSGPDVVVETDTMKGRVEIVDSKTAKTCGSYTMYRTNKNIVIHVVDRRRKAGDCALAWTFSQPLSIEKVMQVSGGGKAIKELLQKCGYHDAAIITDIDDIVVE